MKILWRSDIRNHFKTPPVIQVSSWSLGRHWHSRWTWRWCQIGDNININLLWKFYQDLKSGTISRLHLSSKSLPGVLEDTEILDELVYGILWVGLSFRSFCKSFIKIWHLEPCQDYVFCLVYFGAHKRTHGKCLLFILIFDKFLVNLWYPSADISYLG